MSGENREGNLEQESGGNKKLVVICVVAVVVIAALVGGIIYLMSRPKGNSVAEGEQATQRPFVVTEDNIEEILNPTQLLNAPANYTVSMTSTTWQFEDGKSSSPNSYVGNSTDNETDVYFDIIRNDTQETIYQSPVIPVGEHIEDIVLDKDLDAGNYECTMVYHLVDDEQRTLTTVNLWLMIQISN